MPSFDYTHFEVVESSAVDEVYYNSHTQELAIDLHDSVYVYENVPLSVFRDLVNAPSVGQAYREVKRQYGPGEFLGWYGDIGYNSVPVPAPVQDVTKATTFDLSNASNSAATGGDTVTYTLSSVPAAPIPTREHVVSFVVEGNDRVATYGLDTTSVDEAVKVVEGFAEALGLNVTVKGVYVSFA